MLIKLVSRNGAHIMLFVVHVQAIRCKFGGFMLFTNWGLFVLKHTSERAATVISVNKITYHKVQQHSFGDAKIIIVANKSDLEDQRAVPTQRGKVSR